MVTPDAPTVELPALTPPPAPVNVRVTFGALSHVGKVRANNEDHYLVARLRKCLSVLRTNLPAEPPERFADQDTYMMAVADGMGGYAAGEHASALILHRTEQFVLNAIKWFYAIDDPDEATLM